MAKVRRHVLVCSNLDCLSWPLPRAVVAFELSGPQRLLLYEEIGPVKNKQRQTNLPNSAHRCNGLVIVTIFAPITIDSPPLLGVSRTGQQSPHATDKAAGANCLITAGSCTSQGPHVSWPFSTTKTNKRMIKIEAKQIEAKQIEAKQTSSCVPLNDPKRSQKCVEQFPPRLKISMLHWHQSNLACNSCTFWRSPGTLPCSIDITFGYIWTTLRLSMKMRKMPKRYGA